MNPQEEKPTIFAPEELELYKQQIQESNLSPDLKEQCLKGIEAIAASGGNLEQATENILNDLDLPEEVKRNILENDPDTINAFNARRIGDLKNPEEQKRFIQLNESIED